MVRSPAAGRVVSSRTSDRLGTYVLRGEEVLQIANHRRKEVRLAVVQDDLDRVASRVGQPVRVLVPGGESLEGRLARVKPRASTQPLHVALTAAAGGPLSVERIESDPEQNSQSQIKLLQPHFEAVVPLAAAHAQRLSAGQTVTVFLNADRQSLGAHLHVLLRDWFRARLQ